MIQLYLLAILGCFFTGKTSVPPDNSNTLLWKIVGKNMDHPSFLYGTIHLICRDDFFVTDDMQKAFEAADEVYLEMALDEPDLGKRSEELQKLSPNKELKDFFRATDYKRLSTFLRDDLYTPIDSFETSIPFKLYSFMLEKAYGCKELFSYEVFFTEQCQQQHKKLSGLETVENQYGAIASVSNKEWAQRIISLMKRFNQVKKEYMGMIKNYKAQELDKFPNNQSSQILVRNRNKAWIPKMEKAMNAHSCLFAVGALHLTGKNGLISLLRKEGYVVTPVQ